MEQKEKIMSLMADKNYIPMKFKELVVIMQVPKDEQENFQNILNELEYEGKIVKTQKGKYALPKLLNLLSGKFVGNEKGFGFVEIDGLEEDIFVPSSKTLGAMNGDIVLVSYTSRKTSSKRAECKVEKIVKRANSFVIGRFEYSRNFGFVIPDDKKIKNDIFISKSNFNGAKHNDKVKVEILKYPSNGKKAEGRIVEIFGNIKDKGIDILSLVKAYDIPYEFPEDVLEEVSTINQDVEHENSKNRVDLTNKEIFTIDGEDAKDLDDAVCVEKLENGNYLLGVHIADVSYYVRENSPLDKEAIKRGTSVYLIDRVVPMLPKELSNGICSLNAGKKRFTLSINMEIDKNGKVVSHNVYKAIIKVTKRMSYNEVYKILKNEDEKVLDENKNYINHFKLMEELSLILKNKRKQQGSLDLDIPEAKITVDENGRAIDVKKYDINIANNIIEEFMLIANQTIAEKFFWLDAPFIYRIHEIPDSDKIDELNRFLYTLGYKIKGKNDIHPKAITEVLDQIKGKDEERVISTLILRTLKLAKYSAVCEGHFGLSAKYYCHFTSPIRRYPDLFIHRVISRYLETDYMPWKQEKYNLEKSQKQAEDYAFQSSECERRAEKAEREADDIKKAEYMEDKIGEEYDGIISSITSFGMFVELENTVEGLIRLEYLEDDYYIFDDINKCLIGERTKKKYKIGDKLRIQVASASAMMQRIDFELINK